MPRCLIALLLLLGTLTAQDDSLALKSRQGNQLMAEGKFSEAAAVYTELVRAVPNNPGLLVNLGMAQHMAGQHRPAITNLEAALRLQPGVVPALVTIGSSYLRLGEPAKAVPPLREVAATVPGMKEPHALLAQALSMLGRHEESAAEALRWAELEPASAEAWYGLGVTYGTLANRVMAELEKSSPTSGYALALTGWLHAARGNYGGAFQFYREALAKQPGLRGIHTELAVIYRETGHPEWAPAETAKEQALPALDCKKNALECAFRDGRYQQVLALSKTAKTAESLYWQSRAYNALAEHAFERLRKLPASAESHALLARVSREQGRHSESVKLWREALKLRPGDPLLEKDLLISLRLNEDYEAALPIARKLFKRDPQSGELNYLLGQILLNSRNAGEAEPYLETAARLEPGFLPARASLGLALLQNGKAREAIPHLEAALPTDADGSLHFRLARAYQGVGQQELARKTMAEYQQISSEQKARSQQLGTATQISPP